MDITDLNPEKNRSEIELRAAVDACIKFTAASVIIAEPAGSSCAESFRPSASQ